MRAKPLIFLAKEFTSASGAYIRLWQAMPGLFTGVRTVLRRTPNDELAAAGFAGNVSAPNTSTVSESVPPNSVFVLIESPGNFIVDISLCVHARSLTRYAPNTLTSSHAIVKIPVAAGLIVRVFGDVMVNAAVLSVQ